MTLTPIFGCKELTGTIFQLHDLLWAEVWAIPAQNETFTAIATLEKRQV
jgi:hypothetical protein